MRALLVVNVNAQTVTETRVSVIERALASEWDVELVATKRQGHATHLAKGAAHEGIDLVVAMGGDGTVNEVANGLALTDTPMAVIPAGGTNVLARSLGIPRDPIEATGYLLDRARKPPRRVALGRADGRYFTFGCGVGFDGAIVRDVERRQALKRTGGHAYFVWSGLRLFFAGVDRRVAPITLRWGPDLENARSDLFVAITQKTSPFTYLGPRPLNVCPQARIDKGVDCLALDKFTAPFVLRVVGQMFGSGRHVKDKHVLYLHDEPQFEISSEIPLPMEMDGEYVGERTRVLVESVPEALSLVA